MRLSCCSSMRALFLSAILLAVPAAMAADVTNPSEVGNVALDKVAGDILVQWDAVTLDATGNPESVDHYEVYRGTAATFVPDKAGGSNRIASAVAENFNDVGAAADAQPVYFYLVSAVDPDANEGLTRSSRITGLPTLSGFWTDTTIELDWTAAQPLAEITAYRMYRGEAAGVYDFVDDVSLAQIYSAIGLTTNINYHFAVTAVDNGGNESAFSNEHTDPLEGRLSVRAHDESELCWDGGCPPSNPAHVQRSGGFQLLVPTDFPAGDWGSIRVDFTMDSRLCTPPEGGNTTKCGPGNPCVSPPCNGGYNTCGDPWDRTAHLFMVLDDCVDQGTGCINGNNIELMRSVTPFGTDADAPAGTGVVPPRLLTLDITPFAPLLAGQQRYIGAHIGHFVQTGWWVTTDFYFSKRPEDTSPKPPADGFAPIFFHSSGAGLTGPFPVSIPATADQVIGRLFITGHGGNSDPQCINPADEFCPRTNRILVNATNAWEDIPWRDCCYPRGTENTTGCPDCSDWNACGFPSCTFDRSGWCPGEIACHDNLDEGCDQDLFLTPSLPAGQSHDIEYEIEDVNGSWSRSLVVYWYDDPTAFCGNDVQEGTELCDGADLAGHTCQDEGFDSGTLACDFDCQGYNTASCSFFACGNTICEASAGEDCLSCSSDCNSVDPSDPTARFCCGDGDGLFPVDCSDPRCTALGNTCEF